jgi:uncharacterized protein
MLTTRFNGKIATHFSGFILALCYLLYLGGCHSKGGESAFGLRTVNLQISGTPLTVEVADTPQALENGLMFRTSLPEDRGMLFVFDEPRKATFWMKNTKIPLSIAFVDSGGSILEIKSMFPFDETVVPSASDQVAYALEVNQGWFDRHHISAGSQIEGIPRK